MLHRHVILEGKPTTGKTEVSQLLRIYFPRQVVILPELTTVLVRENHLDILRDRARLTELLLRAVPARAAEVRSILADRPGSMILEESHMGVHLAYARVLGDQGFLQAWPSIEPHVLTPDLFLRLDIPTDLSVDRQIARGTKDVEVGGTIVAAASAEVDRWHASRPGDRVAVLSTDRSPEVVLRDLLDILGLVYHPWA